MDASTQNHLTAIRRALTLHEAALRAAVHAVEFAHRDDAALAVGEVSDRKDLSVARQQVDLEEAQERREIGELAQVRAALARLDAGCYGDCIDCGEAIPWARLSVQPQAVRCAGCQARAEHARD